jgi:hypothetical protein
LTRHDASGSIGGMRARITETGLSIDLSPREASALENQLGEIPARGRPEVRDLHRELEAALALRLRGAKVG